MKRICQVHTNRGGGIIILTRKAMWFPKRIKYNAAVVNRLHCVTGWLRGMMNCFALHFQFTFIRLVSLIIQSWSCTPPSSKQQQTGIGFLM